MTARPPTPITTARLLLRAWRAEDAPALRRTIDRNLVHLQAWMPWAMQEPSTLDALAERLRGFGERFEDGLDFPYGIFVPDGLQVLGGIGLHPRDGGFEIGYWIDEAQTRQGLATEAAQVLVDVAWALPGTRRIEIRCDPRNLASAGVPRRLGFRHETTLLNDTVTPQGAPRDTMVWVLEI